MRILAKLGSLISLPAFVAMTLLTQPAPAGIGDADFLPLDMPGAARTLPFAVNGTNVVGNYEDNNHVTRGFLWNGSTFTTLLPPTAVSSGAVAVSGNVVVGYYQTSVSGRAHAFSWNGSAYTTLDPPGATFSLAVGVSGGYVGGGFNASNGRPSGFIWNGTGFTTFDSVGPNRAPQVIGSNGPRVVGYYYYPAGTDDEHGFLWDGSANTSVSLDYPGALETQANGVSGNKVVGGWWDATQHGHGFVWDGLAYMPLDVPEAEHSSATAIEGENVLGGYNDGADHGFFWNSTGGFTILNYPGATSTTANGLNGNTIVGYYTASDSTVHGFIATVPEPVTLGLISYAAMGILLRRRPSAKPPGQL